MDKDTKEFIVFVIGMLIFFAIVILIVPWIINGVALYYNWVDKVTGVQVVITK